MRVTLSNECFQEGSTTSVNEIRILGSFDNLKSRHVRLLQEAARLGPVHVLLLSDQAVEELRRQTAGISPGGTPVLRAGRALCGPADVGAARGGTGSAAGMLSPTVPQRGPSSRPRIMPTGVPFVLPTDWHTS